MPEKKLKDVFKSGGAKKRSLFKEDSSSESEEAAEQYYSLDDGGGSSTESFSDLANEIPEDDKGNSRMIILYTLCIPTFSYNSLF